MEKGQRPKPPAGLSRQAELRWQEQADSLFEAGRLTAARLELLTAWATAIDGAAHARAAWQEHGSPLEQPGRSGQPRPHHLKVSLERAESQLAMLTSRLERSAARREQRRQDGVPIGARQVEIDGEQRVIGEDGRLLMRSAYDGRWMLDAFEEDHDHGAMLRWLGEDGLPRFREVPPWRMPAEGGPAAPLPWPELEQWAGRVGVPLEAVREWYERPRRAPSRFTYREDQTLDDILRRAERRA
jgi:hypothetical protein